MGRLTQTDTRHPYGFTALDAENCCVHYKVYLYFNLAPARDG